MCRARTILLRVARYADWRAKTVRLEGSIGFTSDFLTRTLRETPIENKIWSSPRRYMSVRATIETGRLVLRPFESGDVEAAFAWFGDPIVMRFTPNGPDTSIELTKARLGNYQEHQTEQGFSRWIVLDRHSGRPIGDSGLLALQEYGWIDLGFRLAQPYWAHGWRRRQHHNGFKPYLMISTSPG